MLLLCPAAKSQAEWMTRASEGGYADDVTMAAAIGRTDGAVSGEKEMGQEDSLAVGEDG